MANIRLREKAQSIFITTRDIIDKGVRSSYCPPPTYHQHSRATLLRWVHGTAQLDSRLHLWQW